MTQATHNAPTSATAHTACDHQATLDRLRQALGGVLRGKASVIEDVLTCLLARGHLLLEDLPGLGKTTLAKSLAVAVGGRFARVQCTPDLLPGDVTGFNVFNQKTREFEFLPGPVFADVLLADEINRATPRTQSALFEAMSERQVTIDNVTHRLPPTFFVIATQNPVESHGAYPLPEAQLDRFAMKLTIGYPDRNSSLEMLAADVGPNRRPNSLESSVVDPRALESLQDHVANVTVSPAVQQYLVDLAEASRRHPAVSLGVSPRGLLLWQRVAQGRAHLQGRHFVTPDDVQHVAGPLLAVRLTGDFTDPQAVIAGLLAEIPVPVPLDGR